MSSSHRASVSHSSRKFFRKNVYASQFSSCSVSSPDSDPENSPPIPLRTSSAFSRRSSSSRRFTPSFPPTSPSFAPTSLSHPYGSTSTSCLSSDEEMQRRQSEKKEKSEEVLLYKAWEMDLGGKGVHDEEVWVVIDTKTVKKLKKSSERDLSLKLRENNVAKKEEKLKQIIQDLSAKENDLSVREAYVKREKQYLKERETSLNKAIEDFSHKEITESEKRLNKTKKANERDLYIKIRENQVKDKGDLLEQKIKDLSTRENYLNEAESFVKREKESLKEKEKCFANEIGDLTLELTLRPCHASSVFSCN